MRIDYTYLYRIKWFNPDPKIYPPGISGVSPGILCRRTVDPRSDPKYDYQLPPHVDVERGLMYFTDPCRY